MSKIINMVGRVFGKITVIRMYDTKGKQKHIRWLCVCECGNSTIAFGDALRRGNTKSCGCLRFAHPGGRPTHGHTQNASPTREWLTWAGMRQRCLNPNNPKYKHYGGRGIRICERWEKFENFLADMGPKPKGMTLDRFPDNNGDYEPGNSRWATYHEQNLNRRTKSLSDDEVVEVKAWLSDGFGGSLLARMYGVSVSLISQIKHGTKRAEIIGAPWQP
jgi:hypothetical protein